MAQMGMELFLREGHAIIEKDTLVEPVTTTGYYRGTHGFNYYAGWHNGQVHVGPIGFSDAYVNALRDYERQHGAVLNDASANAQLTFIAKALGLL